MLNVADELKLIYKNDTFPLTDNIAPKELDLNFPDIGLSVSTDKFAVDKGDFELHESLSVSDQIKFGKCNASSVKFTLADVNEEIKDKEFSITQTVTKGNTFTVPFGYFTVKSALKQDDLRFKDIVAYDRMKKIEIDVANWYNSLPFPMTLAAFRSSFLTFVGLEEDTSLLPLPNDSMTVQKTVEPSTWNGREVIEAIEELNGCFGHINRYGKFSHVFLNKDYGLYPAETLYPADNLYPEYGAELVDQAIYTKVEFAEYTTKPITKLQIRQEEYDIGCIVGSGSNTYTIEGNFLLFGKGATELEVIANKILNIIQGITLRPFQSENIGLPYVELGDPIGFEQNDYVISYVLERTLTGIQALTDQYGAKDTEVYKEDFSVGKQIKQLQSKTAILKKSVDEVSVTLSDLADETDTKFSVVHGAISAEVTRATDEDEFLLGQLDILAGSIVLKVGKNDIISSINLSPETIKIQSGNIELEGIVTANSYFKILADGSMQARNGYFNGVLTSESSMGTMMVNGAALETWDAANNSTLKIGADGSIVCGHLQCDSFLVDGHQVITTGNIDEQSVEYASNSGSSGISGSSYSLLSQSMTRNARISANDNLIPSSNIMYIGSSGSPWAGGFGVSGWITTSDERKKYDIRSLDERYLLFAKGLVPMLFKLNDGTSGRDHCGFIAQNVKNLMDECCISDKEFAGYIASPVYAEHIHDKDGNELPEYDLTSDIIDYDYSLRYEEFIPLLFLLFNQITTA